MGLKGRQKAKEQFDVKIIIDKTEDAIKELTNIQ